MPQFNKIRAVMTVALAVIFALLACLTTACAQTQTEMNQAAGKAARSAETEMAMSLKKLNAVLTPAQKIALRKSQLAWIKYRDAEAAFLSMKALGGSVYPTVYAQRIQELTQARSQQLKKAYTLFTTEGEM